MEDPFMAVTCSKELEKLRQMQMQNKGIGIDLAASVVVAPSGIKNKKNRVAEFRDRLMRGF